MKMTFSFIPDFTILIAQRCLYENNREFAAKYIQLLSNEKDCTNLNLFINHLSNKKQQQPIGIVNSTSFYDKLFKENISMTFFNGIQITNQDLLLEIHHLLYNYFIKIQNLKNKEQFCGYFSTFWPSKDKMVNDFKNWKKRNLPQSKLQNKIENIIKAFSYQPEELNLIQKQNNSINQDNSIN